ncbi:FAD-binding protein [Coprothermobacteraceae bacterium]|nr:FAD-binding protein [Coprothermobacteraceae bacterium]
MSRVLIAGAGPAGIMAALRLSESLPGSQITIVEKGKPLEDRICPLISIGRCANCRPCSMVSGWGGAGAYSDGKLNVTGAVGGLLPQLLGESHFDSLVPTIMEIFRQHGAPAETDNSLDKREVEDMRRKATLLGMKLITFPIVHLGTDKTRYVLGRMYETLLKRGVQVLFGSSLIDLVVKDGRVIGGVLEDGRTIDADFVILAVGRSGADDLTRWVKKLGLTFETNPVDIGVRVEVPAEVLDPFTETLYEVKLEYYSKAFEDRVRTFCMNPHGEVVKENLDDVITVNGHSYKEKQLPNTNFAVLVSTHFTEPFKDPVAYGKHVARLANLLSDGIIVQRLGDLVSGRRSTWERIRRSLVRPSLQDAVPGDLNAVIPRRQMESIVEFLMLMDKFAPGVGSRDTLLYGVEVKFYSMRPKLTSSLESEVQNLYMVGDGAGITRGLFQAAMSGVVVADSIRERIL